jgi:uncharacterized protein (DUF1330 family)
MSSPLLRVSGTSTTVLINWTISASASIQALADFGGWVLARGDEYQSFEGGLDLDRIVIVGLSNFVEIKYLYNSDTYVPFFITQTNVLDSNIVIIEGL